MNPELEHNKKLEECPQNDEEAMKRATEEACNKQENRSDQRASNRIIARRSGKETFSERLKRQFKEKR